MIPLLTAGISLSILFGLHTVPEPPPHTPWLSGQLMAWRDDMDGILRTAQALGYNCVADNRTDTPPPDALIQNMSFYLHDPHKNIQVPMGLNLDEQNLTSLKASYPNTFLHYPELPRAIDELELAIMQTNHPFVFSTIRNTFERVKCWANTTGKFPDNIAIAEAWGSTGRQWEPCSDFQQQQVIDDTVDAIVAYARGRENPAIGYLCEGVIIDVVELWNEFNWNSSRPLPGSPDEERYSLLHGDITHEYSTLREGWYVFLGQLRDALENEFGRPIHCIWEPTPLYNGWVQPLAECTYPTLTPELFEKIKGDAILQEKPGLEYLMDERLTDGLYTPYTLGTCSSDLFTKAPYYPLQLKYMAEITVRGGTFISYLHFDRSWNPLHWYDTQFKLIRAISSWEMENRVPLARRQWDCDKKIYCSPVTYGDLHALAGLHPKNGKLYAVLIDETAAVPLAPGVTLSNAVTGNTYLEPEAGTAEVVVENGLLKPAPGAEFPVTVIADVHMPTDRLFQPPPGTVLNTRLVWENLFEPDLFDPDFEEGGIGWYATGAGKTGSKTDVVYQGERSLMIWNRPLAWYNIAQEVTGYLIHRGPGTHHFSAWVHPKDSNATFCLDLKYTDPDGEDVILSGPETAVTSNTWTQISADFPVPHNTMSEATFTIRCRNTYVNYYTDQVAASFTPAP